MKEMTITSAEVLGTASATTPKPRGNRATRVPTIIEVSINVFATEGNVGFTQRRIASDAAIRLGTLQHYFGTREELLRATIETFAGRYLERFRSVAQDNDRSPQARLDAIIDELFSMLMEPGTNMGGFILESWSLAESELFVHELTRKVARECQEMLAGLVANINPTLTNGECALRGALLVSHLHGLVVFVHRAGDSLPGLGAFRDASKAVWRAISNATE
jgi:AcrR family transcriptional regulator